MNSTLTSKGQITIPGEIRKRLGLKAQDKVEFSIEGERIILLPVRGLKSLRGSVTPVAGADHASERETAKKAAASRVMEEME